MERLASLERAPCSPGEREAAEWIAERLREAGCRVRIESERVHGSFQWPLGVLAAAAAAGGIAALRGRRTLGALLGGLAAACMWEDLGGGHRRPLRRLLPRAPTPNVVAEAGDPAGERTLVIHAHHDAAHTSFIFDQRVPRFLWRVAPGLVGRLDRWPPPMALVFGGPLLIATGSLLGSRRSIRAGTVLAGGTAAVMGDMVRRPVVPGANDNLTAVAVLLELARKLREQPPAGLRVLLVSMGAEESNQEGMIAFAGRHFGDLPPESTWFVCLDTVGSPELILIEGEGFLRMRDYPEDVKSLVSECAREAGIHLRRGLRTTYATDGLIPLRRSYPTASIASVNEWLVPSNYHWPTDTPDRVDYGTVASALALTLRVVQRLAR
ncbi:MAG TPA: M28 family peptidase [Thermoleophilaceae bacterium]|nr:M28 family peptidase [Thermoleophilaceae bacterium]